MKLQHLLHDGRTSNISAHVVHPRILCNSSLYRLDTTTSNSDSNTNSHNVSNNEDEVVPFTVIEE